MAGCGKGNDNKTTPTSSQTDVLSGGNIPPEGGQVTLSGVATITLPEGSFGSTTTVDVSITSSQEIAKAFDETAAIFQPGSRMDYEIRINIGKEPPLFTEITVEINVPDDFLKSMQTGYIVQGFAQSYYEDDGEETAEVFDSFQTYPSKYNPATKILKVIIPNHVFTNKRTSNGDYEAIITLGSIKEATSELSSKSYAADSGKCPQLNSIAVISSYLGKPIDQLGSMIITGAFGEPGHSSGFHWGTDIRAKQSISVYATTDGYIERAWEQTDGNAKGNRYVIVRNTDGSATAYHHLTPGSIVDQNNVSLPNQTTFIESNPSNPQYQVKRGRKIAESGSSGTGSPHLHVEFAPIGGSTIDNNCRRDPIMYMIKDLKITPSDKTINIPDKETFSVWAEDEADLEIRRTDSKIKRDGSLAIPITANGDPNPLTPITDMHWFSSDENIVDVPEISQKSISVGNIDTDNGENDVIAISAGTAIITAKDEFSGKTATATVTVKAPPQTLAISSFAAIPSSGPAPLNGVDLTATVGGTATGTINYTFYCNRSDTGTNITSGWAAKFDGITENPKMASDACNYTAAGTYMAKVIVERGTLAAQGQATITVTASPDTTAPSIPTFLSATAVSSSQINLSWNASTDNVGVSGYKVYRNGTYLKSVTGTSTGDTGLSPSTQYCYTVSAYDAANNESVQSSEVCATTQAAGTVPSSPTGVTALAGDGQVIISWNAVFDAISYNLYMASVSGVTKTNYNTLSDGMKHTGVTSPYIHPNPDIEIE